MPQLLAILLFSISLELCVADETTSLILINGATHENNNLYYSDILGAFNAVLKVKRTKIFSSIGSQSAATQADKQGYDKRTPSGLLVFTLEKLPGDVSPAIKSELAPYLASETRRSGPVTLVITDHGSPDGACLADSTFLSLSELSKLEGAASPDRYFRHVYKHCHSAAMLADPKRIPPEQFTNLPSFLRRYYRKRSCGLATADSNQFSWAISLSREAGIHKELQHARKPPWEYIACKRVDFNVEVVEFIRWPVHGEADAGSVVHFLSTWFIGGPANELDLD